MSNKQLPPGMENEKAGIKNEKFKGGVLGKIAIGVFAAAAVAGGYLLFDSYSKKQPPQDLPDARQEVVDTNRSPSIPVQATDNKYNSANPDCSSVSSGAYNGLVRLGFPINVGGYKFDFKPSTVDLSARSDISYASNGALAFPDFQAPLGVPTIAVDPVCHWEIKMAVFSTPEGRRVAITVQMQ